MKVTRRRLTSTEIARQLQAGQSLGPGVWVDRTGALHFSVPEILAFFNVADTSENRDQCMQLMLALFREQAPEATVIVQDPGSDG